MISEPTTENQFLCETENFFIPYTCGTNIHTYIKYKSNLKLDAKNHYLYIKFHNKSNSDDVAINNDKLIIGLQNHGYSIPINKKAWLINDNAGWMSLKEINDSNNVYVLNIDVKTLFMQR